MAKKSITARWVLNTLCAIIFVLFCIIIVVSVLFKEQYYETVRVTLDSRATNVVSSYFSISNDSSDDAFNLRAKEFVEDFSDKSVMEVWVIDRSGNVVVSSSGFSVENEKYPDYAEAKLSDTGKATWVGKQNYCKQSKQNYIADCSRNKHNKCIGYGHKYFYKTKSEKSCQQSIRQRYITADAKF